MSAIKIKNLYKQFNNLIAVDGIDLEIEEGVIFGLLGPNGAGKSTTINMLNGSLEVDRGEIEIFGRSLKTDSKEIKRIIGVVPQELAIFEELSAYENVKFFGVLYGFRKAELEEKVIRALQFVGLEDRKKDLVKTFSGGMKRRINIACGIVHSPKLIIMDEPTVGIDPQSRNYILKSIQKLNEQGATILYTTHYIHEAEQLCTQIAIIDEGKIITQGTIENLKNMISEYIQIQIELGNILAVDIDALKKVDGITDLEIKDQTLAIKLKKEINSVNKILEILNREDTQILGVSTKTPNLEDVFLHLTGKALRD